MPRKRGCTHSRSPRKPYKCRSAKEHERAKIAYARRVANKASRRISSTWRQSMGRRSQPDFYTPFSARRRRR